MKLLIYKIIILKLEQNVEQKPQKLHEQQLCNMQAIEETQKRLDLAIKLKAKGPYSDKKSRTRGKSLQILAKSILKKEIIIRR